MRVLHINNVAGVAMTLAKAQRREGYQSRVLDFATHRYYEHDVLLSGNDVYHFSGWLRWADLIHVHGSVPGRLKRLVFRFARQGRTVVFHFHGTDLRNKSGLWHGYYPDECIISTPDLIDNAPRGVWIPPPVDEEFFNEDSHPKNLKNVVGLRVSSHGYKPTKDKAGEILLGLEALRERRKDFDILLAEKLKHSEMSNFYQRCNVVIDDKPVGWFGLMGEEAMAMGIPVVSFVRDDLAAKYDPWVLMTDGTPSSTVERVNSLLDDAEFAEKVARQGKAYALREFKPSVVGRRVMEFYARKKSS